MCQVAGVRIFGSDWPSPQVCAGRMVNGAVLAHCSSSQQKTFGHLILRQRIVTITIVTYYWLSEAL